ncbi:hypothetical protein AAEX28_06855 [Lentisphaerota bacterium WC36G]|nr:hypothetical protein LJT99_09720 [Lentisphaerae bacterium WC36]
MSQRIISIVQRNRDKDLEENLILCSEVELMLRNAGHNGTLNTHIRVSNEISQSSYITVSGKHKIDFDKPFSFGQQVVNITDPQFNCQPTVEKFNNVGSTSLRNTHLDIGTKFFVLNFCSLEVNKRSESDFEPIFHHVPKYNIDYAKYLAKENNLHGNWNNDAVLSKGAWEYTSAKQFNQSINILNHDGVLSYQVCEFHIGDDKYAILPVSYFSHPKYNEPLLLFLPPKKPYTLMNISIMINPFHQESTILLTDDYMFANNFKHNENQICLCNIGGDDWIEHLDIAPLKGKSVQYLIKKDCKKSYKSALKIAEKFKINGLNIKFTFNDNGSFSETLKLDEFIKLAEDKNLYIPPTLDLGQHGEIDLSKLPQPKPIFENLISTTELTLIHEHQGIKQNIITSLIASAISNGKDIFTEHWLNKAKQSKSCLVYIDTENQQQYRKTLMAASNGEIDDKNLKIITPMFLEQKNNESLETFQKTVKQHNPKLIIFDAKTIFKDTKSFEKFMTAINYTQNLNIGIIVIVQTEKDVQKFKTYDKLIDIYPHKTENNKYIVESLNSVGIRQGDIFSFKAGKEGWNSKLEDKEVLKEIYNRTIKNVESGIDPSMDKLF